ncbi:MAG: carboxypeptidase-like regulatory domain-containing protein [Carboxylicivirga sp.]|jgi:hypothetical protein|nr:carboxypeptidase-like regulatory domain-containing protein [Carboxylicivirga sp.]
MEIKGVASILCIMLVQITYSQNKLEGHLLDYNSKEPIAFANIYCSDSGKGAVSDIHGNFTLSLNVLDSALVQISCIGYETLEFYINPTIAKQTILLYPKQESIAEVSVIADEKKGLGTASLIKKDALKHLQPSSFADVLELLPGGSSTNFNMTSMQLISLRETDAAASSQQYNYNSSFGTSFIIDGQVQSNDAHLQSITGYGGSGSPLDFENTNTTGKGIDMRLITTDNIESVEIIRGIPSVKYGDLTSGVVVIRRKYTATPFETRFKADPGSKLFSLGKGLQYGTAHNLSFNIDYLDYKSDPRNPNRNYNRITGSTRYKHSSKKNKSLITLQTNIDYTGSFDQKKIDPEIDNPATDRLDDSYNKLQGGVTITIESPENWFSLFEIGATSSYTHSKREVSKAVSGNLQPITTSTEEGEYYGIFLPGSYVADYENDSKPFFFSSHTNNIFTFSLLGAEQNLLLGGDFRYDKNFGDGEVYDVTRPLYPGTGRQRASKDIPAIQKLSIYAEDNFTVYLGTHQLHVMAGVRAVASLGMNDKFKISNKPYFDPRINAAWQFPTFKLFEQDVIFTLNGGFGWQTKFPGLSHLYPQQAYYDKIQLNFYSQNEAIRQLQYKTVIYDRTNHDLEPNRNKKIELGFKVATNRARLDVTAYYERSDKGFRNSSHMSVLDYKIYDTSTGPAPAELTAPPTVDMFNYEELQDFVSLSHPSNGAKEVKKGIEYQLDLGRFEQIQTRITLNGAYLYNKYDLSQGRYYMPSTVINSRNYPYYGYYEHDNRGKTFKQFNTNVRFDTQIDELGLIFSTTIQNRWFSDTKYNKHDGMPEYYIGYDQIPHVYLEEYKDDPILGQLYTINNINAFKNNRVPYEGTLNLKVTKLIGERMRLAFYVNSLLNYAPDYEHQSGITVKRHISPYFGMELNINL